jgi:hypothetical protein
LPATSGFQPKTLRIPRKKFLKKTHVLHNQAPKQKRKLGAMQRGALAKKAAKAAEKTAVASAKGVEKATSVWSHSESVIDLTNLPDLDIIQGKATPSKSMTDADLLVVAGCWEEKLRCSVESLAAKTLGLRQQHWAFSQKLWACKKMGSLSDY